MKREDHLHRPLKRERVDSEPAIEAACAARVLALAIMSDGRLQADEVAALDRVGAYGQLDLDRERFYALMRDTCERLLAHQSASGRSMFQLDEAPAIEWIDGVRDPAVQQTVADLALTVIRSDGQLHPGESRFFWRVLDRWGVTLDEVRTARWAAAVAAEPTQPAASPVTVPPKVYRLPGATVVV